MRIWLNDKPITLIPGMTIRQILIQSDCLREIEKGWMVYDEWDNEVGLDGAIENGSRFTLRPPQKPVTRRKKDNGSR